MIWLLLAWCGVAVWLGLAIGRVLRESRHEDPVANRSRMQLVRAVPEARSSHTHEGALRADEIHEFHHLLSTLNKLDPKLAKTAMLRWIGGLSKPAIAATLGTTVGAVEHDLQLAKFLLRKTVRTLPTEHSRPRRRSWKRDSAITPMGAMRTTSPPSCSRPAGRAGSPSRSPNRAPEGWWASGSRRYREPRPCLPAA